MKYLVFFLLLVCRCWGATSAGAVFNQCPYPIEFRTYDGNISSQYSDTVVGAYDHATVSFTSGLCYYDLYNNTTGVLVGIGFVNMGTKTRVLWTGTSLSISANDVAVQTLVLGEPLLTFSDIMEYFMYGFTLVGVWSLGGVGLRMLRSAGDGRMGGDV